MTVSLTFGFRSEPIRSSSPEGLLVFSSLSSLIGPHFSTDNLPAEPRLEKIRLAVLALVSRRIDVVLLSDSSDERQLAEHLGLRWVDRKSESAELTDLAESLGVPYWRTAAVGTTQADHALLDSASLPFWLSSDHFEGARGAVELRPGDITTVAERLLGAWLPEPPHVRSHSLH